MKITWKSSQSQKMFKSQTEFPQPQSQGIGFGKLIYKAR